MSEQLCKSERQFIETIVESLTRLVKVVEKRAHFVVRLGPLRIGVYLRTDFNTARNCIFQISECAIGDSGKDRGSDDTAFSILDHHDRAAIDAGFDLEPETRFRATAACHQAIHGVSRLFHQTEVAPRGESDPFHNRAVQMSDTVTARQAEELRAGVLVRAEPFSVEIRDEK